MTKLGNHRKNVMRCTKMHCHSMQHLDCKKNNNNAVERTWGLNSESAQLLLFYFVKDTQIANLIPPYLLSCMLQRGPKVRAISLCHTKMIKVVHFHYLKCE